MQNTDILWFKNISIKDVSLVGGKTASLGEMYTALSKKGVRVPNGFAVAASAYRRILEQAGIEKEMRRILDGLNVSDVARLASAGKKIRSLILRAELPADVADDIASAYAELSREAGTRDVSVAVRSSATAEDLPGASFAGQQETFLNVRGVEALLSAVKGCMASLYTDRAISYRVQKGFDHLSVSLSVCIQQMVDASEGASGVLFTLDTESGHEGVALVNAAYGLGEYVVKGVVTPDQYFVFKEGLKKGKRAIISRSLGGKEARLVIDTGGTKPASVSKKDKDRFALSDDEVLDLTRMALVVEEHYGNPQDIEWAKDGASGELFIVQARPETVIAAEDAAHSESFFLKKKGRVLAVGTAVGRKIGAGRVHSIDTPSRMTRFKEGEVLVTAETSPDWEPIMRIAGAIVTERGGKTSHAAIVSRELGVPCVVGVKNARSLLKDGASVTVSCAEGEQGFIYKGLLPFEIRRIDARGIGTTKTRVMMNVGDPLNAFHLSRLPGDGVGLARLEFIFSNFIRIHPLALVHFSRLTDARAKKNIAELTSGYRKKTDFMVDKLAEGIARIAAGFYPRTVVVRLTDFKTNEYAKLLGGKEFEPEEENPMLGWRGASRYYSKEYEPAFALECAAIKKVREEWGLENVIVMVPFCRTPEEGERVLAVMEKYGLKRGDNGLKVFVMCEIPSNVILAGEFAKIFDGFSIGSNDLTQLALGVDRDSELVAHVFDDTGAVARELISSVIRTAHKRGRPVGICGQAPSDHPEFAEFLVGEGIDSISVNPDTLLDMKRRVADVESTVGKTGRKTNLKMVGLVAAVALLGGFSVALGGGCSEILSRETIPVEDGGVTPADIRMKVAEKVLSAQQAKFLRERSSLTVSSFDAFSLRYPVWWSVSEWEGGVTLSDPTTDDYMSIFKQLVSFPSAGAPRFPYIVDSVQGSQFRVPLPNGKYVFVIEAPREYGTLVIQGVMESFAIFDEVAKTLKFQKNEGTDFGRAPTHWDVRERRFCVPMVTFARENKNSACQPYPNPCAVPEYFEVCDAGDE